MGDHSQIWSCICKKIIKNFRYIIINRNVRSVLLILLKNVSFAFLIKTQQLRCYMRFYVDVSEFVSASRPLHSFSFSFINEGRLVHSNLSFFHRLSFLRMGSRLSLNQKGFSKNVFQGIFEKASIEKSLTHFQAMFQFYTP